ncbi:MAG TPA: polysaccharide pyruvyl transferase family protein [Candidatus Paceibacterota bacterium]|nr:polysaccharide pyruvyl transferase family protein [Candidatus Paceibacterota bacterium]
MNQSSKGKILLLDFTSEKNKGDAAMQISTVSLIKKYFNECEISVSTVFGPNQFKDSVELFEYTSKDDDVEMISGIMHTSYHVHIKINRFKKIINLLNSIFLITLIYFRVSDFILNKLFDNKTLHSLNVFKKTNFVIWNGRNFRYDGFIKEPYKFLTLLFNPLVCIILQKPMVCIGASFWKIKNPITLFFAKFVFKRCLFISVRDKESYNNILKIVGLKNKNKIFFYPDLSIYCLKKYIADISSEKNNNIIGITIVGDREIKNNNIKYIYIDSVRRLLKHIINNGKSVVVIPQVTNISESNSDVLEQIIDLEDRFKNKILIINKDLNIENLLKEYSKIDVLIATRMHSAIFSLIAKTPVLSIAYDFGPKWGILKYMGVTEDNIIDIVDLSKIDLIDKYNNLIKQKEIIRQDIIRYCNSEFVNSVDSHIIRAREIFNSLYFNINNESKK